MTLKTVEIPISKVVARGVEPGEKLSAILRRAMRLKKGKALKTYAPKMARQVTARLKSKVKTAGYPLKVSYDGNFVFTRKIKRPKATAPKAAKKQEGATV